MNKAITKLQQCADLDVYQGDVSKEDISAISIQTKCKLPNDYVEFLQACGFAFWTGYAVNGVYDENDGRFPKSYNFSAITQTMRAREKHSDHKYPFYENSVVIGKDDMEGYFLLVSDDDRSSNRVIWINFDEDWVVTKSWNTFESFLESALR